jgi:hypothetical protein
MADLAIQDEVRVETYERAESRFEQKWSKAYYCREPSLSFPRYKEQSGNVTFDISATAWHFGIQTPVFISEALYARWIKNELRNPVKNIETLCHAFMYAVDCNTDDSAVLEFNVPGNGTPSYRACAILRGFKNQTIFLSWVPE